MAGPATHAWTMSSAPTLEHAQAAERVACMQTRFYCHAQRARGRGRAHVVQEQAVGRDEVVLHRRQVQREAQDGVADAAVGRVDRPAPCARRRRLSRAAPLPQQQPLRRHRPRHLSMGRRAGALGAAAARRGRAPVTTYSLSWKMVGAVPPIQMVGPPPSTGPNAGLVWLKRAARRRRARVSLKARAPFCTQGRQAAGVRRRAAKRRGRARRTDEDGRRPEAADGERARVEREQEGVVRRAVAVRAERRVHQALVQRQACARAAP